MALEPIDSEKRGDRIPGSRYFRDFCARCETPIRVRTVTPEALAVCDDCFGLARPLHISASARSNARRTGMVDRRVRR